MNYLYIRLPGRKRNAYTKVSGKAMICIVPHQRHCAYPTETREPAAQMLVSILVWTGNTMSGKGVSLELLARVR